MTFSTRVRWLWALLVLSVLGGLSTFPWLFWVSPQLAVEAAGAADDPLDPWGRPWLKSVVTGGSAGAYGSAGGGIAIPVASGIAIYSPGPDGQDDGGGGDDLVVKGVQGTLWLAALRHPALALILFMGPALVVLLPVLRRARNASMPAEALTALQLALWPAGVGFVLGNFLEANTDSLPFSPLVGWKASTTLSAGLLGFLLVFAWRLGRPRASEDVAAVVPPGYGPPMNKLTLLCVLFAFSAPALAQEVVARRLAADDPWLAEFGVADPEWTAFGWELEAPVGHLEVELRELTLDRSISSVDEFEVGTRLFVALALRTRTGAEALNLVSVMLSPDEQEALRAILPDLDERRTIECMLAIRRVTADGNSSVSRSLRMLRPKELPAEAASRTDLTPAPTDGANRWPTGAAFPLLTLVWVHIDGDGDGEFVTKQGQDGEVELEFNGEPVQLAEHDQPVWQLRIKLNPAE